MNRLPPPSRQIPQDAQRRACLQWLAAATSGLLALPHATAGQVSSFYDNFSDMRLLDQEGAPLPLHRLIGRLALFNFVFTGCSTVCPVQTRALAQMQQQLDPALRSRLRLVSISLDPLNDTPAALKAYAKRMSADLSGWSFVTGRHKDIDRVSDKLRLFRPGPDVKRPDDHQTSLWLINAQGQIGMRYRGDPPDVPRLLRDIAALDQLSRASRAPVAR